MSATKSRRKPRKPRKRTTSRARPKPDAPLTKAGPGDKLNDAQQTAVVQRLAMYDGPQSVVEWVKEEFDIVITKQAIQYYDPTVGEKPAEKWCAIFDATRKKFLDDTSEVPIALRSVRLRRLDLVCVRAQKQGNHLMVLASTEQAAKEVGELYTNRHKMELSGKDGGPIEVKTDDLRKRIVGRINGVASRIGAHQNNSGADARRAGGT
jgi:hypothetical protein